MEVEVVKPSVSSRFVGSFTNKIDAKGRISVPAEYRRALGVMTKSSSSSGETKPLYCFASLVGSFLECGGEDLASIWIKIINHTDHFSEIRHDLEYEIFSGISQLAFDENGRVIIPPDLRDYAQLTTQATFAGYGNRFFIKTPQAHSSISLRARAAALQDVTTLKTRGLPSLSDPNMGGEDG